jgi:fimbrial isopeptide formation D2 family protein/uncharacterized repeat protein (TIGR01451 family)
MDTNKSNLVTILRIAGILLALLVGVLSLAQDIGISGPTGLEVSVCGDGKFDITISTTTPVTGIVVEAWVATNSGNLAQAPDFTFVSATGTSDTSFRITWPSFDLAPTDPDWTNSITVSPNCDALSNRELVVLVSYDDGFGGRITEDPVLSGPLQVLVPNFVVELDPDVVTGVGAGEAANWEVWVSNTGDGTLSGATVTATLPVGGGMENLTYTPDGGTIGPLTGPILVPDLKKTDGKKLLGVVSATLTAGATTSCKNLYVTFTGNYGCAGDDCQDDVVVTGSVEFQYRTPNLDYTFTPATITTIPYCGSVPVTVNITNSGATAGNIVDLSMKVDSIGMAFTTDGTTSNPNISASFNAGTSTFSFIDYTNPLDPQPAVIGAGDVLSFTFNVSRTSCAVVECRSLIFIPHFYDDCGDEFEPPIKELQIATYPPVQSDYNVTITPDAGNPAIPNEGDTIAYTITTVYSPQSGETGATADIAVTFPASFAIAAGTDTGYTPTGAGEITWEDEAFGPTVWTVSKRVVLTASYAGTDCTTPFRISSTATHTSNMCGGDCPPADATATRSILSDTLLVVTKDVDADNLHPGVVYAGDALNYTITVNYYGPKLLIGGVLRTPPAVVTDTLPGGMRYAAGSGSPVPNSIAGNTLTWCLPEDTLVQGGAVGFAYRMEQIPLGTPGYDECLCGTTITNTATATLNTTGASPCAVTNPSTFSCSANAALTLAYDCQDGTGFRATKTTAPASAERCDYEHGITFTNTITLLSEITNWHDVTFTDNGNALGMVFENPALPTNELTGVAHFTLNGGTTIDHPITLGTPLDLADVGLPLPGTPSVNDTLVIEYTLYFSSAANTTGTTGVNWSDLAITGTNPNPNCPNPQGHIGAWVTPLNPSPTIAISDFCHYDEAGHCTFVVNRCDTSSFRVYLTSTRDEYGVTVKVDTQGNYTFEAGSTSYVNITRPDGSTVSAVPTEAGGVVTWDLGDLAPMGGDSYIQFNLLTACSGDTDTTATVESHGRCGDYTYSRSQTYTASRGQREGKLLLKKTPDIIYIKDRGADLPWTIYVTNPGNGPSTSVVVTDTMESDISYVSGSATLDGSPATPTIVTADIDSDTRNETTITFNIPRIDPGKTVTITLKGHVEGCTYRTNAVSATWGCPDETSGNAYCGMTAGPVVTVQDLGTRVIINNHHADDINTCGGTSYVTVKFKNIGEAYAYDMVLTETLPGGVEYDNTRTWTAVDANGNNIKSYAAFVDGSNHTVGGGTLTWTFSTIGMKPVSGGGDEFTIRFPVKIIGCSYASGATMTASLSYNTPCSPASSVAENAVSTVSAPVLTVSKSPAATAGDPSEPITWNIEINNPSAYTAESVLLWDVPPSFFSGVDIVGGDFIPSGDGTDEDHPWIIGSIAPHGHAAFVAEGMLTSCAAIEGQNTAWVEWCEDCKTSASSNVSGVSSTPTLTPDVTTNLDYCGGQVTLTVVNSGSRAYHVSLVDTFPEGFKYQTNSAAISSNIVGRTFSTPEPVVNAGANTLTWDSTNFGDIQKFETLTITFNLENEKDSGETCTSTFGPNNDVHITYDDYCGGHYTADSTDAVSIPAVPNLSVTKTLDPDSIVIGETEPALWHVTIQNNGGPANGTITIVDTFGTGWDMSTVTAPPTINGTGLRSIVSNPGGGGSVTWSGVTLNAGLTVNFDISVRPNSTGPEAVLTNDIAVTGACIGGCTYGSATATSNAIPGHTAITKVYDKTSATIGETVHVTIRADYYGSSTTYTGITITDTPPAGFILGAPTVTLGGAVTSAVKRSGQMIWDVANFTGRGWVIIEYDAVVDNAEDIGTDTGQTSVLSNTATNAYTTTTGTYSESATASLDVLEARLIITKNDSVGSNITHAGEVVTYTIEVYHPSGAVNDTTAQDIVVTDLVPSGLTVPTIVSNNMGTVSAPGDHTITWTIPSLATSGGHATLIYTATVLDSVHPGDSLNNTANVTWTSLSGTVPGERTGTGTPAWNDYSGHADNTLTVENNAAITKTLTSTSPVTIGSDVTYRLNVTLPRATIPTLTITDTIGGTTTGTNGLRFNSATLTLPNGSSITPDSGYPTISGANDGTGQVIVTWQFTNYPGYVGTDSNRDLVINVTCDVPNVLENQDPETIPNSAICTYTGGTGTLTSNTVDVLLREANLTITKTHVRYSGPANYQAGTVVEYTLTVTNSGGFPASDVEVQDTYDSVRLTGITWVSGGTTHDFSSNPLKWTITTIPNGGSVSLHYRATIASTADVKPEDVISNTAETIWQSLDDTHTIYRNGTYGAAPGDLNNYYARATDSLTVYDRATIYKNFQGQSLGSNTGITVTVGSPASYTITVALPRATIPDLTITDTLPVGVRYVPSSASLNAPYSGTLTAEPSYSGPNDGTTATTLTWTYSSINATAGTSLAITFNVEVMNQIVNQDGRSIPDTAIATGTVLDFSAAAGYQRTGSDSSGNMTVREANLAIVKSHALVSGSRYEAGSVVEYTLTITNSGAYAASDVDVRDTLDPGLTNFTFVSANPSAGVTYVSNANPMIWNIASIPASGGVVTLVYRATIANTADVFPGAVIDNTAETIWQSLSDTYPEHRYGTYGTSGGLNDYYSHDEDQITIYNGADIAKTPDGTRNFAVGSTVPYTIEVTLPRAMIPDLTITDTLPVGLYYVPSSAALNSPYSGTLSATPSYGGPNDGSTTTALSWNYSNVNATAGTHLIITFNVRVANVMNNQNGVHLANSATAAGTTLDFDSGPGVSHNKTDSAGDLIVIEPQLNVTKNDDDADNIVSAGQPILYTLTVSHATGGASTANAYDIVVTDHVPTGLTVNEATITAGGVYAAGTRTITWTIASILTSDPSPTMTYTATVDDNVHPGDSLKNDVHITWTSTSGTNADERTGTGTSPTDLNNYFNDTSDTVTVDNSADIAKTRDKDYATIGETVTYTITVDLPIAQVPNLTISDALASGYDYVDGQTTITLPNGTTITGAAADPSGTSPLVWSFTNIAVDPGHTNDHLVITFQALVTNTLPNQDTVHLTNSVTATAATLSFVGTGSDTKTVSAADVVIVEANLTLNKSHVLGSGTLYGAGSVVRYTLTLTNNGTNTAYDVNIQDTLPAQFINWTYVSGDVSGNITHDFSTNPLLWHINSLAVGATVTLVYEVTLANGVVAGTEYTNTAETIWQSLSDTYPEHRYGTYDTTGGLNDYYTGTTDTIKVDNTADIAKTRDKDTATIGETVTYTITVDLPMAQVPSLTISDALASGYDYVDGQTTITLPNGTTITGAAADPSGTSPLVWSFTNVAVDPAHTNNHLVITFQALVTNTLPNQDTVHLTNSVTATAATLSFVGTGTDVKTVSAADVIIVEANLTLTKEDVFGTGNIYEAGKVVQYRLTLTNNGTSTANDVNIRDTLPAEFINWAYVSGDVSGNITHNFSTNPLLWHINSLAVGASVVLEYRVTLANGVVTGTEYTNTAETIWQSLSDTYPDHRYGTYGTTGGLNDYYTYNAYTIKIDNSASISKTPDGAARDVTIGLTVPYTITVHLPMATIPSLTVTDQLEDGLQCIAGYTTITTPDGTTISGAAANPTGTSPLTWNFTNIAPDPDHTDRDLVITFNVLITTDDVNVDLRTIPNEATASGGALDFDTGTAGNQTSASDTSSNLVVHVPAFTISKAIAGIADCKGNGHTTDFVEPGDTVTYTITVNNVGSAGGIAYGSSVRDDLPAEFEYIPGSTVIGGTPAADPDTSVAHRCVWSIGNVDGGDTVTITFGARVTSSATKSIARYTNNVYTWGYYDVAHTLQIEADNHARVGGDTNSTDTASVYIEGTHVPAITVTKSVLEIHDVTSNTTATNPAYPAIQPGDWVTYRVVVENVGDGTAYDIDVDDTIPTGLEYGSSADTFVAGSWTRASWDGAHGGSFNSNPTCSAGGDCSGFTGSLSWNGSDIVGDPDGIVLSPGATLTLDYRVYVNSLIIQGTPHTRYNHVVVYGKDCYGTSNLTGEASTPLYTHQPFFVTEKTITQIDGNPLNTTVAVVDSIIDYSYTVTNVGLGDANSVNIFDTLPIGFVYEADSYVDGNPVADPVILGSGLSWNINYGLASGDTLTLTFKARVTDGTSGGTQTNVMWATGRDGNNQAVVLNGAPIIGADVDTDNDDTDDVPVQVDIPSKPLILKKDVTPRSVDSGAVVHYTVTFTNNRKISFYEATITDTLPAGFKYLPGTALVNGIPIADPTGNNPYVYTIGTVGPESVTTLDYYVLVTHAARHGANVNWAVLNAHDGAGKPISLKDRATVTVNDTGFFDFEKFPFPPRITRPSAPPVPVRAPEKERPRPECCLHVATIPVRSQDFGDTAPGRPEIYYQTDIAMYGATELLYTEKRLNPWLEVQGFDPEPKYLMTGLYNRMVTKLGEYAQYNLGNVVMESMLGIPLDYAPGVLENARRSGVSPERAASELVKDLAKRAGLSQAPDIQPIFLEYFGSYPYLHGRIAEDKLAWEDGLMDKNIMPAALGFTMLREANQIELFLGSDDPTERFFGLLLLTQAVEKTKSISTDLARTATFSPPVKYLPHFSRIEVDKGRPGLVWHTTDESSTLYDHASVLWGLSKLRSVILHSADPGVRALLPQITERMDEVYGAIEAIHYNKEGKTFVSVHTPGKTEGENTITAKDLSFTILALRSVLLENRDLSLNTVDPKRKIVEIADFMIDKLMGDGGGIYTAYNYADGTPVVGVKRTLVDNALAVRALLSAYVVTEDRKYRDAALKVYAFMVKELWYEDLMIFIDEENPDYEVVLTPQSIGALIGALRELVLYGDPAMRHDYLDRMSYTTDRVLDQSQLQLYENRFFPWHAPITIVPKDPNGRSYIKPIIATMRDKGISRDLAPILVRKMVLNITPSGAISSGKEPPVSDWNMRPADLRYEVPDVIASAVIDDTFVTDEGMYFTTLTRDYQLNLNKDLPAFNPYNTDPGIQVYGAFVGGEVSRFNVENLTLNSEMGIGLSESELVRRLAEKVHKNPKRYVTDYVKKHAPKDGPGESILGKFFDMVKGTVGLDRNGRFTDIIYLEYASGKPYYTEDISNGWNEKTFDKKLTVSSMSSTMVRQLLFILDNSKRKDLSASERFVNDVITLSAAAKRVALGEIIGKAQKEGITGAPHSFTMVTDEKEKRIVPKIDEKKATLFDDTFAIWAMALYIDARQKGLFDVYRGVMSDTADDEKTLSGLIDALIAHHYSAEYGTLVTGSVNTVDVSKVLDMLTRAAEVMDDGPAKDKLTGLIAKQADFIMNRLVTDTGFAPMVGLGNEKIPANLCEMETLGTNVFPILALVRASEVTGNEKYLKAALTYFDRFDQTKWDQTIGLYLSSGTVYKAPDRSKLELKYNNQELIAAVLLVSKLQPHLSGERKILSAYHMTTFMNRIMEIASVERYPGNKGSGETIFSPEIIRSVKIILTESKGIGKPGDIFTNRIVIDNDCYDLVNRTLSRIRIEETIPEGFHYVPGSTRFNGAVGPDPIGKKTLNWYYPSLMGKNRLVIDYQVVADPGISEGSYTTNLDVIAFTGYGGTFTPCIERNVTATTRIVADPFKPEDVTETCVPCDIGRRALSR